MSKTAEVIARARELFVAAERRGHVVERAALAGAYDEGSWIKDFIPQAERELRAAATA